MTVLPKSLEYNHNDPGLDELGIQADVIIFHPYDRWGFSDLGRAADDRDVMYLTRRLSAFPNVWWSLANEYDPLFSKTPRDWDRIAGVIGTNDPRRHLMSIHNCISIFDHSRPWVTYASIHRTDPWKTTKHVDTWRRAWGGNRRRRRARRRGRQACTRSPTSD